MLDIAEVYEVERRECDELIAKANYWKSEVIKAGLQNMVLVEEGDATQEGRDSLYQHCPSCSNGVHLLKERRCTACGFQGEPVYGIYGKRANSQSSALRARTQTVQREDRALGNAPEVLLRPHSTHLRLPRTVGAVSKYSRAGIFHSPASRKLRTW
jgi:hypothetical protein